MDYNSVADNTGLV